MDKNQKLLKKLSKKEFDTVQTTVEDILLGRTKHLDIKKMTGHKNLYRVRVQNIRIIFLKIESGIEILEISRRNENTYKNF